MILLFVMLGNPASGGPYARDLLPGFWRSVGGLLPPGAGIDAGRGVLFFGGAGTWGALGALAVWAVAGAGAAVALGGRVVDPDVAEGEAAAAAAA